MQYISMQAKSLTCSAQLIWILVYSTIQYWQEPIPVQSRVPFHIVPHNLLYFNLNFSLRILLKSKVNYETGGRGVRWSPSPLQDASFRPESVPSYSRCSPEGSHPAPTALC